MMKNIIIVLVVLALIAVVYLTWGNGGSVPLEPDVEGVPNGPVEPSAVSAVRNFVVENLGVSPASVNIISSETREWPNSCLGLNSEDEMCAEVVTPGYEVVVGVTYVGPGPTDCSELGDEGEECPGGGSSGYEVPVGGTVEAQEVFRTNEEGSIIRQE